MSAFDPALAEEAFEDDVEGLAAFLRSVVDRVLENIEQVRKHAAAGDAPAVRAAAHAAKGSAGHLGSPNVQELASKIELSARDGKIETEAAIAELDRAARALQQLVEAYIRKRAGAPGSS